MKKTFIILLMGPKPVSCPSWVPDEPDGDDSDYTKGPMDEYGWLRDIHKKCRDKAWRSPLYQVIKHKLLICNE